MEGAEVSDAMLIEARRMNQLRISWLTLIGAVVLIFGLGLRLLGIAQTTPGMFNEPLGDDAYYYFTLGQHIAAGEGMKSDDLHLTTGFQPLWGGFSAAAFVIAPDQGIVLLQLLGVLCGVGTFLLALSIVQEMTGKRWIAVSVVSIWWLLPQTIVYELNGQETSLAVFAAFVVLWRALRYYRDRNGATARWLGLSCGVAVLARIDLIVLVGLIGLWVCIPCLLHREWGRLIGFILCAALPLLPWIAITVSAGLSPIPESGAAIKTFTQVSGNDNRLATQLQMFFIAWNNRSFAPPTLAAILLAILLAYARRFTVTQRHAIILFALWLFGTAFAYAQFAPAPWFYDRYTLPLAQTFGLLGTALVLMELTRRQTYKRGILLGVYAMLLFSPFVSAQLGTELRWLWFGTHSVEGKFEAAAQWINENAEAGDIVGALQSGFLTYYIDRPVINLDGKVNSGAHQAQAENAMWRYVCNANITYIVDFKEFVEDTLVRDVTWKPEYVQVVLSFPGNLQASYIATIFRVKREYCAT